MWLDASNGQPLKFTGDLREGDYKAKIDYYYDWGSMVVNTRKERFDKPSIRTNAIKLSTDSYDGLALFWNLRQKSLAELTDGKPHTLRLVLDKEIRTVTYRFLGREEKKVPGKGRYKTLKFSCTLATSTGESFEDGSIMYMWVSDDDNRIPIFFESPIKIGSVRAYINTYKGLRYPMDALVK